MSDLHFCHTLNSESRANDSMPTIESSSNDMLNNVWKKIISYTTLNDDWDSYGASPPSIDAVYGSVLISNVLLGGRNDFPEPDVFPVPNGNIQLEWSCDGVDLEIEIFSEILMHASFEDLRGEKKGWEEKINFDFTEIDVALNLIADRRKTPTTLKLVS